MSFGNQKNLVVIAAVAAGLLAGTVLLGSHTHILGGRAKNLAHGNACPPAGGATCTKSQCNGAKFPTVCASGPAVMTSPEAAKPCCAKETPVEDLCPCGKPAGSCAACAEEPTGCCSEDAAGGCCAKPEAIGVCCAAQLEAVTE